MNFHLLIVLITYTLSLIQYTNYNVQLMYSYE